MHAAPAIRPDGAWAAVSSFDAPIIRFLSRSDGNGRRFTGIIEARKVTPTMKLKIRTMLPVIVSALALLLVVSTGLAVYDAMDKRQEAEAFLDVNQISQLLLQSAGQWAVERGMTNAALKAPEVLSPEHRAEITKMRAAADQAFRAAVQHLRVTPAMKSGEKDIVEAERAFGAFEAYRAKVDENLAKPGAERPAEMVEGFLPTMSNLISV